MSTRVLFSWIGFRDLNFIADQLNDKNFFDALQKAKTTSRQAGGNVSDSLDFSPIVNIVNYNLDKKTAFIKLILFCDLNNPILHNELKKYFQRHIDSVEVIKVSTSDVHNYGDVLSSAIAGWRQIDDLDGVEACFNLSSGTTAMGAFLTVLGQARYADKAKFIQVGEIKKEIQEFSIDFNLASLAVNETFRRIDQSPFDAIIGESLEIKKVKRYAEKAARTDCNVLIYGETGTGKELFAKAIHDASSRKDKRYYAINCAALPPQLLESELFGSRKGAFTDAVYKKGLLEKLNGGTLFIDELEACPHEMQAKLLRVLQPPTGKSITCRCFTPIGSDEELESDIRIIAATNEHLKKNDFRSDLLNRVATLNITLPPLRYRQGDIRVLMECLFVATKEQLGSAFNNKELGESAINFIESRAWFGNVRELKNALTQAIVFSETDEITEDDFDQSLPPKSALTDEGDNDIDLSKGIDLKSVIEEETIRMQKKYVEKALSITGGNKTKAAELLGITYQTIDNWKKGWEENDKK